MKNQPSPQQGSTSSKGNPLARFNHVLRDRANHKTLLNALTAGLDMREFLTCAWIQVQTNPGVAELAQRYPERVFRALLQAARMGIYLDGVSGDGYLIRYGKDVNKATCVAQRGYRNYIRLFAENNPDAAPMPVVFDEVREKDFFEHERGSTPRLKHIPANGARGDVIAYYAAARFRDGSVWPKVMSVEDVEKFKTYAKTMDFWESPHENTRRWMRIKTVIRQLFKEVPIPRAARRVLEEEESFEQGDGEMIEMVLDSAPQVEDKVRGGEITPAQSKPVEGSPRKGSKGSQKSRPRERSVGAAQAQQRSPHPADDDDIPIPQPPPESKRSSSKEEPHEESSTEECEHGVPVDRKCVECNAETDAEQENPFQKGFFE